jgi:integrase
MVVLAMQSADDSKGNQAMTVAKDRGSWRYRTTAYYADGTSVRIHGTAPRYENTRDRALALEAEHVARIRALLPGQEDATEHTDGTSPEATQPPIPTVAEFAPLYLEFCRLSLKRSTLKTKRCDFKNHILPSLGHLRLDEVSYGVLEDFKLKLCETQSKNTKHKVRLLSAKSVHNVQLHVSHMLSNAQKRGLIAQVPEIEWIKVPDPGFDFLTFEEAERLCKGPRDEWRTMIFVALRTGMRRGELLGLRWEDVDLSVGRIHVRQTYVQEEFGTPKSGKPRLIPLGDDVIEELRIQRHDRGPLVFCDHLGKPLAPSLLMSPLKRATKRAGLRDIGWHVLRHTFASHLVMRGVALKIVQELLGHSAIETTMIYAHLMPEIVRDAVRALDGARPGGTPSAAPTSATSAEKSAPNAEPASPSSEISDDLAKDWRKPPEAPLSN